MKLKTRYKLESAVSTDKFRGAIQNVYLDAASPNEMRAIATDGHILASVPVEALPEEAGILTPAALKAARKLAKKGATVDIACNGNFTLTDGTTLPRIDEGIRYPQWRQVMPAPDRPTLVRVALNAAFLQRLSEAIGNEEIILEIEHPEHSIRVLPLDHRENEAVGVLMPIRVKQSHSLRLAPAL